jgi:DNA-binding CsgD family transcriptional regulator
VQWAADLIEAYVRCGRIEDAQHQLAALATETDRTGQRWGTACVARYRGMLAAEDDFEHHFEQALAIHQWDPSRFETARTQLCLGQRRRRARRRADARAVLHSALDTFDALGAVPWADQVRVELRATGEAPSPSRQHSLRDLTPQELQVALIVAHGATNKETAAALFLSPKTIEFHLQNAYRKLAIRSRAELARTVALAG